jgi:hypothetical protein
MIPPRRILNESVGHNIHIILWVDVENLHGSNPQQDKES